MAAIIARAGTTRERIEYRARSIHLSRVLLVLLAVPFFVAGWVAGHIVKALIMAAKWLLAAAAEGYLASSAKSHEHR